MRTPKYMLHETDSGMDGVNPRIKLVARFDSEELAKAWLDKRGFSFKEYHRFAHVDPERRHCMGQITYTIHKDEQVPENPE
jgi:hypothetical protein